MHTMYNQDNITIQNAHNFSHCHHTYLNVYNLYSIRLHIFKLYIFYNYARPSHIFKGKLIIYMTVTHIQGISIFYSLHTFNKLYNIYLIPSRIFK